MGDAASDVTAGRAAARKLVGREEELELLIAMIDRTGTRGGALVVRGEAGIGKSALLGAAVDRARVRGVSVASTTGTQSEARYAFGALHRLLLPFLDDLDELPAPQRRALDVAFGVVDGDASDDVFLIGLATLGALTDAAARTPLVLVIEDAHWLDRASVEVLTFVARRIAMEGILMLFAVRDGVPSDFDAGDLPTLHLTGLDHRASQALLAVNGAALLPELQKQILDEAAGNPLALIELPIAAAGLDIGSVGQLLPLTARLEATFAARLDALDGDVRTLLLVAALGDGNLTELSRAAEELREAPVYLADWTRTAAAGLGAVDSDRFRFHHPLMRSAIHQAGTEEQRRQVHAALARAFADEPDRAVWHLAAAASGPDESVAKALVAAAARARSRGDLDRVFSAFEQAAALTMDPRERAMRLLNAADVALEASAVDRSVALYREALQVGLPTHEAVRVSFVLEAMSSAWSGATAIPRFAEIAEQLAAGGDDLRALATIATVGLRAYIGPLSDEARQHVSAIVSGLDVPVNDPRRLATLALIDPLHRGSEVVAQLEQMSSVDILSPRDLTLVGEAASAVWADNLALPFLRSAVDGHRAEGQLVLLGQTLVLQAWADARRGAVRDAITAAAEAARVAQETRQLRYVPVAKLAHAAAAGGMGDEETAARLTAEAESALLAMGAHPLLALVAVARGRTALSADRPAEAYSELARIFAPTDTAYQPFVCGWALADLAESAVHANGDLDFVRGLLRPWQQVAAETRAPHLNVQLAYAAALLTDGEDAQERFRAAISAGAEGWPFYAARAQLAFGQWLRRQHRDSDARSPLREAAQAFGALGQQPYVDRALRELRASGERARRRTPEAWIELSPQELQIAELAAEGYSNREIGQRLYLSHRTIGTHLYNIFPKLGITSRAQLRDALPAPRDR